MKEEKLHHITQVQSIKEICYEKLYTNKLENLEEMDKFLEACNFPTLNHEGIEMNRPVTSKKNMSTTKNKNKSYQQKAQNQTVLLVNFTKDSKKNFYNHPSVSAGHCFQNSLWYTNHSHSNPLYKMDVVHIVVHVREFHIHRLKQLCFWNIHGWLSLWMTPRNKESQIYLSFSNPCKKMKREEHFKLILGGQHWFTPKLDKDTTTKEKITGQHPWQT